jgi:ABC-2 type transport system permease protein
VNRTFAIAKKESIHIMRDVRSLIILFFFPVVMVFLYGYAINMDVKHIPLGIWDADYTPESRALVADFVHSGYFVDKTHISTSKQANDAIRQRQVSAVLFIPENYARDLQVGNPQPLGVWVDGSDANNASVIIGYVRAILATETMRPNYGSVADNASAMALTVPPFQIFQKVFYNPELESTHFIVPGLVAVLMMMICALLTSLAIVREKESGTFEQLMVSPIRARELIIGKVLPYLVLAFIVATFILAVGHFHFGVPVRGNLALLAAAVVFYLFSALALGLLISTIATSQRIAMLMAITTTMLPSVILSGFIFQIRSMPLFVQLITYLVPARYFLSILRGIMLKGSGLQFLWHNSLALIVIGVVLIAISVFRFRRSMIRV